MKEDEQWALAMAVLLTFGALALATSESAGAWSCTIFAVLAWTYVAAKRGWSNLVLLCLWFWVIAAMVGWVGSWS